MRRWIVLALLAAGAAFLAMRWPLVNDVETGKSPGYPDLTVREYRASEDQAAKAVKAAVERLPRWQFVGAGSGPAGHAVQAVYKTSVLGLEYDVSVRVKRDGASTRVSVRSKSRKGPVDFGQNARVIRELLSELERTGLK